MLVKGKKPMSDPRRSHTTLVCCLAQYFLLLFVTETLQIFFVCYCVISGANTDWGRTRNVKECKNDDNGNTHISSFMKR